MSEPKDPPSLGDAAPARKASRKSSSKKSTPPSSADAGTPHGASTQATSSLSTHSSAAPSGVTPSIPRIPLAEPKADVSGVDPKRKASKKRTSTTTARGGDSGDTPPTQREATPPGPAVPTASLGGEPSRAADAAAASKQREEAEREKQARREAKRVRAKEVEDARRRDELAQQALEEARRQEEQRQRETRQKEQLAALNANAEECQEEAEENEYEDDGFEDFEQEEESEPKPTPLTPATSAKSAKARSKSGESSTAVADGAELKRIQLAMQAESKGLHATSSRPPSSSETIGNDKKKDSRDEERSGSRGNAKPVSSIASSIAGLKQSLDPRAKRAKEILELRKFDVEKFSLFQQNPMSEQEQIMHRLRRGIVRQAFVQTSDGARTLKTQTEAPETHSKSMQFPDDIGVDTESAGTGSFSLIDGTGGGDNGSAISSSARFFKFLEHAAYVCETLVVENVMAAEALTHGVEEEKEAKRTEDEAKEDGKGGDRARYRLSKTSKLDRKCLFPNKERDPLRSLEQVLQGRDLVALRFSPAVSSMLLACYGAVHGVPANDDGNQQQEPAYAYKDKTISCVWDVNLPHRPLHLLKNEGVVSAACLGPSRELFALVGTEDGSLHVWDLRPQSLVQSASPPLDGLPLNAPAYFTCGMNYRAVEQHASTIVALEPIDRAANDSGASQGGTFQFGSMDDRGILIIWSLIEFETGEEALVSDKCVEIGGHVKMVMNTRIDLQQQYMTRPLSPRQTRRSGSKASTTPLSTTPATVAAFARVGPVTTVLKCFPRDPNQYVFA
ncbi:hypothetical protein BBJ28_00022524 [Nothophytophthora sp. Chile5]|nr:hypothetical protein BBJ28_00022524 [Nothophytophthora sp. Chile5]